MSAPLDPAALASALARLPGWRCDGAALVRTWRFASFAEALRFMAAAAEDIDRLDHHPDWTNRYDRVTARLTTHDAGHRITARDVALAKLLDWHADLSGGHGEA